jgi:hypothetical protein
MVIGKDSDEGLKLARVFWIGLGRPPKFNRPKFMVEWAPRIEALMRKAGMGYEDFKWFLIWSTRLMDDDGANWGNNYSAKFLRVAEDPMQSLEKNFPRMMFEIYSDASSQKKLPYLKDVHQKEQEMLQYKRQQAHQNDPSPKWDWYEAYGTDAKGREAARHFTALDERFPMLEPAAGEELEDFVDRMFQPFSDNRQWRCPKCKYNPSATGVRDARPVELVDGKWVVTEDEDFVQQVVWYAREERLQWCPDCLEEYLADRDEDIIVHAQDNSPHTHLDLVYRWDDSTHSLRFNKFQLPNHGA